MEQEPRPPVIHDEAWCPICNPVPPPPKLPPEVTAFLADRRSSAIRLAIEALGDPTLNNVEMAMYHLGRVVDSYKTHGQ